MELAAAGENMKKLREIARAHIERAAGGDMPAIKELADRLDGKVAQMLEHADADSNPLSPLKIVREIVHIHATAEDTAAAEAAAEEVPVTEWRAVRDGNGSGGLNEDTARSKR